MILALAHAKVFAQYLSQCESKYIMQLALRELGISSARDGFHYALQAAIMLERNPGYSLAKEVYPTVGQMRDPAAGEALLRRPGKSGILCSGITISRSGKQA